MNKKAIIIPLLLCLTACAQGHFENPNVKTQAQLQADTSACNYESLKATGSANLDNPIGTGMMEAQIYNACMGQKGYVIVK